MQCPSCEQTMEVLRLRNHLGTNVEVDLCWPCHLIWFDHLESTSLNARSVVEFFRAISAHQSDARNVVSTRSACPTCSTTLMHTSDIGRAGRFTYHRCAAGHGRLISFVQFLREKQFIRTLAPAEIRELSVKVAQVRCSSCGASVDLGKDTACTHCGSAIAVLDRDAVAKALAQYDARDTRPSNALDATSRSASPVLPRSRPEALLGESSPNTIWTTLSSQSSLTDLVVSGLAAALAATLD